MQKGEQTNENQPMTVDIWSATYNQLKPYIHPVKKVDGKTLYKSSLDRFYFLIDR